MTWKASLPERWNRQIAVILAHGAGQGIDSPFMKFFQEALPQRGLLSVQFNFEYIDKGKKVPDPQPKMQALYRQIVSEVADAHRPEKIFIGGKSMGGRVASMVADGLHAEGKVAGLLCLGYPFHPPDQPDRLRTAHLKDLRTPALIVQGTRDPFGGRDEVAGYGLAPSIRVVWMEDGDHSFKPRVSSGRTEKGNLEAAVGEVAGFVNGLR